MAYLSLNNALSRVVNHFQSNPERFWNERDIHWSLFYYLKLGKVSEEAYPTELIRAEFPTLKVFERDRGHYDLVIINEESYNQPEVQNMKAQASWDDYLKLIRIDVAIEIKIWQSRINDADVHELIDWDIRKLTEQPHKIQKAYFLNFVQLDFQREHNRIYYQQLREYLSTRKLPGLSILCVPSDSRVHSDKANWL